MSIGCSLRLLLLALCAAALSGLLHLQLPLTGLGRSLCRFLLPQRLLCRLALLTLALLAGAGCGFAVRSFTEPAVFSRAPDLPVGSALRTTADAGGVVAAAAEACFSSICRETLLGFFPALGIIELNLARAAGTHLATGCGTSRKQSSTANNW